MKRTRLLVVILISALTLGSVFVSLALGTPDAEAGYTFLGENQESAETAVEIARALAAEKSPTLPQQAIGAWRGGNGPLFVGVDNDLVDAYTIDVNNNDLFTAFNGVDVWGSAYDSINNRVLFNSGSVLWQWPVGGIPQPIGTMTINGSAAAMVGLAYYNGTLYASRNIAPEDIYAVDVNTLAATLAIDLIPDGAALDLGGIDIDATGQMYGVNDDADMQGLVRIDPDGTVTLVAPYPDSQTDIDGLAVGGGKAYLVTDQPGFIYVFDLDTMTYDTPLNNPWTDSELFSAGAWIEQLTGPHVYLQKTVGTDSSSCAASSMIDVEIGTTVTYCYEIFNTGDVTFTRHDLADSELGDILSDFSFSLAPGASAFLTQTAVITTDTTNTATWTAYNPGPTDVVSNTSTATVNTFGVPEIEVNPTSLSSNQAPETQVNHTLIISNVGTGDLNWNIIESASAPALPAPAVANSNPQSAAKAEPVVSSADQCADYENYVGAEPQGYAEYCFSGERPLATTASSSMSGPTDMGFAHDIRNTDNLVEFTLNDFPNQTPTSQNTDLIYGYDFNGSTSVLYALNDGTQQLGTMNRSTGVFTSIGSSIPKAGHTWTGLTVDPRNDTVYASSTNATTSTLYILNANTGAASVVGDISGLALIIDIAMNMNGELYAHDIGTDAIYELDPNSGAPTLVGSTGFDGNFAQSMDFDNIDGTLYIFLYIGTGANVYGTVNLTTGAVTPLATDNPLGEFEGATITVGCSNDDLSWVTVSPSSGTTSGGSASDVTVTFDSTGLANGIYTGTLCITSDADNVSLVTVPLTMTVAAPVAGLSLAKTVSTDGSCGVSDTTAVMAGTEVTYCYTATNTGNTTLDLHDLEDNKLGNLLSNFAYDLNPGESVSITETATIMGNVTNMATWTASSSTLANVSATANASATIMLDTSYIHMPFMARNE